MYYRLIFLSLTMIFVKSSFGQTVCPNKLPNPTSYWGSPNSYNNWNWKDPSNGYLEKKYEFWTFYQGQRGWHNPFYLPNAVTPYNFNIDHFRIKHSVNKLDIQPQGGWELLYKDFGTSNNYVHRPFFALYNKYTGRIRAFFNIPEKATSQTDGALIGMKHKGMESGLFANASPQSRSVIKFYEERHIKVANEYSNQDYYWIMANFSTAYDPCVCRYNSDLAFTFSWVNDYQLKLRGTINGTLRQIATQSQGVIGSDGYTSTFSWDKGKELFKEGKKGYNSGKKLKASANKIIDSNASFLKNKMSLQIDNLKKYTDAIPYVSTVVNIVDFLSGGGSKKSQNKDFNPMAFESNLNFKGSGQIRDVDPEGYKRFHTPGSRPDEQPGKNQVPYYNNPLGVFNLLKRPKLKYVDYEQDLDALVFGCDGSGIWAPDVGYLPYIRQVKPVVNDLQYVVNPTSGLRVKSIEAAIQLKFPTLNKSSHNVSWFKNPRMAKFTAFDKNSPHVPKPVFLSSKYPQVASSDFQEWYNKSNFRIEKWPKTFPNNANYVSLRSPYVSLSCFKKQSLTYYTGGTKSPYHSFDFPEVEVNCKLKIKLERKDGKGQDVLLVRTYPFEMEKADIEGEAKYSFNLYKKGKPWKDNLCEVKYSNLRFHPDSLYVKNGSSKNFGPALNTPFKGIKQNINLLNQTVNNDQNAYQTITVENSTIKPGLTLRAGKDIEIKGQSEIKSNVVLTTDGPLPSCGEPNDQYQATQQELQTFCNSTTYQDRIQLAKKGHDPQPKSDKAKDKKKPIQVHLSPNPVKNNAQVGFKLPKKGRVKISIQGVSGRLVKANVVNQTFRKGPHRVSLQTSNLSPGFYICVIQTRFGREKMRFVKQ